MSSLRRMRLVWYGLVAGTGALLVLALSPPFLPGEMQALVRGCFASVCHQLPSRSPHLWGIPLAVCDRCTGIYLGFVVGVAGTGWGLGLWRGLGSWGRYLLLGALIPVGVDWVGPVVGLWGNGPISRVLTGGLFGVIAASYVTDRLLRRVAPSPQSEAPE